MSVSKEQINGKRKFKSGKEDHSKPGEPAFRFINIDLTREQKDELKSLVSGGELTLDTVLELHRDGYKVTLSSNDDGTRFTCSITDKSANSAFWNACITASGSTPINSIHALLYKHYVVAAEDWSNISVNAPGEYD